MAELKREVTIGLDISADEAVVLTYAYNGAAPIEVVARVDLGAVLSGVDKPIGGGGTYFCRFYVDDILLSPDAGTLVSSGVTKTILVSRALPLEPGDVVEIRVTGLPGDTSVNVIATLRDATPIKSSDIIGPGSVAVDHDYGGIDALAVATAEGVRIANAVVRAYRAVDYAAHLRSLNYVVAATSTDVDGRWKHVLMLDPGDYTLLIFANGVIQTRAYPLSVA